MSFSDLTFLFYFLPLFFAVYYILPFRFKNAALVLGSFAFYFIGAGARDTLLLSGVLLLHYALARAMAGKEVRTRKALLIIALAADLFCLVYFKYAAFILENLGKLMFSLEDGVSLFTLQTDGDGVLPCRACAAARRQLLPFPERGVPHRRLSRRGGGEKPHRLRRLHHRVPPAHDGADLTLPRMARTSRNISTSRICKERSSMDNSDN